MAFSIQLHISTWLYLISLPFQFAVQLGWWSMIIVAIGSFCMLGVLAIGYEIENPFGYDENDLVIKLSSESVRCFVLGMHILLNIVFVFHVFLPAPG